MMKNIFNGNEGYSYDEINSKYSAVANKLPYSSVPQEEKDRTNIIAYMLSLHGH